MNEKEIVMDSFLKTANPALLLTGVKPKNVLNLINDSLKGLPLELKIALAGMAGYKIKELNDEYKMNLQMMRGY